MIADSDVEQHVCVWLPNICHRLLGAAKADSGAPHTLQDPGLSLSRDNRCVCCSWQCWCVSHAFSLHAQSVCQERGLNLRLEMGAVEIPGSGCLAPWNRIVGRTEAMKREGEEPLPSLLCRFDAPLLTLQTYSACVCVHVCRQRKGEGNGRI